MLFRRDHVSAIESGRKVQTRRTWKACRVKVGRYYPIQVDYRTKAVGYVRVEKIRIEPLDCLTEADAQAEGGYTREQFKDVWKEINGSWVPNLDVWVIEFAYVGKVKPE